MMLVKITDVHSLRCFSSWLMDTQAACTTRHRMHVGDSSSQPLNSPRTSTKRGQKGKEQKAWLVELQDERRADGTTCHHVSGGGFATDRHNLPVR